MAAGPALVEEMLRLDWTPVSSSTLKEIAYAPDFRRLWVAFEPRDKSGRVVGPVSVYAYHDVPETIYRNLLASSSKGQYLDRHVKKALFGFTKVQ